MNANEFTKLAKESGWSRKQTRDQLYRVNDEALWAQRDEILMALGFAATQQPQTAAPTPVPQPVIEPAATPTPQRKWANKYAGECELTGQRVEAGEGVCLKFGSAWCVLGPVALTVCVCAGDERKLLSAAMIAGGADDPASELDHEDYALLEALQAACDSAGISTACQCWPGVLHHI